jgi:hypothetical protein
MDKTKENLTEYMVDYYNNKLDEESEMLVLNFLEKLGVDLTLI